MSKSLGNFYTLRDLLNKGYNPIGIRYLLLSTHYRQQLNFTEESLQGAENSVQRINDFILKLRNVSKNALKNKTTLLTKKVQNNFESAMDNDLNVSSALAYLFDFIKEVNILINEDSLSSENTQDIISLLRRVDTVFAVMRFDEGELSEEIKEMINKREIVRKDKDYVSADKIRKILREKGIILEDTPKGVRWKRV
jgi:cysteinyl-tRNA synthetase